MRTLIVGAGAVGGYLGAHLVAAGRDVTFLVRGKRAEQLHAAGLVLTEVEGHTRRFDVDTVTAEDIRDHYDIVLLAVKGTALHGAIDGLRPAMHADTSVVPVLNGVRHIGLLRDAFGSDRILGGVAVVATELEADGTIVQLAPGATLTIGELSGRESERVRAVRQEFSVPGFDIEDSLTIWQALWDKWLFMASGGAATALLGGPVGAVLAVEDGEPVLHTVIGEVVAVLSAAGHAPSPAAVDRVTTVLTSRGSAFTTSLFRDFVAGRRTEVEPILGDLVELAMHYGVDAPLVRAAAVRLRVHNATVQ